MNPSVRACLAFLWCLSSAAAAQQPVIEISGANFKPLPLAVAVPQAATGVGDAQAEFDGAMLYDFAACGLFQVLDRKSFLARPDEGFTDKAINFRAWDQVGAQALVKTLLTREGDALRGELKLFSVGSQREELKTTELLPARDVRRLAHRLANAVYKHFTRESGPFESRIAFARRVPGGKDIFLADWDGRNPVAVAQGGINVLPALLPDRSGAAFTSYRRGKPWIYAQRPGGEATLLVGQGQMASGVAYSATAKKLAYAISDGERSELWVANLDGTGARQLTDTRFFLNSSPTWSPDGKQLAFVSNRQGNPQLYVMSAEGGEARRLTFQGTYNTTPAWSPRGDVIAFTARDERNVFDLFTVNVASGRVSRLTQGAGNNEEPAFSPNGRLILFVSTRAGPSSLYVMTAEGNNQVPLPVDRGEYFTPDW